MKYNIPVIVGVGGNTNQKPKYGGPWFGGGGSVGGFGGGGSFGKKKFFNWQKPAGYTYWNPGSTQTQNQAANLPDYKHNQAVLDKLFKQYSSKSYDDLSPFRADQAQALSTFKNALTGEGESYASQFLKNAQEQNIKASLAAAASAPGNANAGLVQRNLNNQLAAANQTGAANAAALRLTEAQQYFDALGSMRSQDLDLENMRNQMTSYYLSTGINLDQAQQQANMALESLLSGQYQAAQSLAAQQAIAASNQKTAQQNAWIGAGASVLGSLISAGGNAYGSGNSGGTFAGGTSVASDENLKEEISNIKDTDREKSVRNGEGSEISHFLDTLQAYRYRYKEPEIDGQGQRFGVMAQDVEKTPVGQTFVKETPRGKVLDPVDGFGVVLASLSNINQRLKAMEGRK